MERMNLPERRALICHLVDEMRENDSWAGHTHIQKCVLFLQDLFDVPTGYDFVPTCMDRSPLSYGTIWP